MEEERTVNRALPGAPGLARKCQMKNKWRMLYSADYSVFTVGVDQNATVRVAFRQDKRPSGVWPYQ